MDSASIMVVFIAGLTVAITLVCIYTAFGPGSQDLEDTMMTHDHGPGGHSHGHNHGHSHAHSHNHSHDHETSDESLFAKNY
ncbi:MAG: photosystem II reaction center protein PsbN [Cyanobacteria bacterium P01_H01_bin.15]